MTFKYIHTAQIAVDFPTFLFYFFWFIVFNSFIYRVVFRIAPVYLYNRKSLRKLLKIDGKNYWV